MRRRLTWEALIVAMATQMSLYAALSEKVTEELHKTYPIAADGRVSLKNVNGNVPHRSAPPPALNFT